MLSRTHTVRTVARGPNSVWVSCKPPFLKLPSLPRACALSHALEDVLSGVLENRIFNNHHFRRQIQLKSNRLRQHWYGQQTMISEDSLSYVLKVTFTSKEGQTLAHK